MARKVALFGGDSATEWVGGFFYAFSKISVNAVISLTVSFMVL